MPFPPLAQHALGLCLGLTAGAFIVARQAPALFHPPPDPPSMTPIPFGPYPPSPPRRTTTFA
jgi:hypothetical protein